MRNGKVCRVALRQRANFRDSTWPPAGQHQRLRPGRTFRWNLPRPWSWRTRAVANGDHYGNDDGDSLDNMSALSGGLGPVDDWWKGRLSGTPNSSSLSMPGASQLSGEFSTGSSIGDIEAMLTTPLEGLPQPAPTAPRDATGRPGVPGTPHLSTQPPARGNQPPAPRPAEDYTSVALRQRRAEDERMTGRRWPGNGVAYPGSAQEAAFFEQLAIALGEAEPRVLARECALRYVRSSRIPGEDELAATDIYSILYYGLGLTVRPLDCTGLPQALALYHRATRDVYVDWKLLQDPPFGRTTLDPSAWRRAVDGSLPARFLLAWCAAIHLTDNFDLPLMLGFTPHPVALTAEGTPAQAPAIGPDLLNRYRKAVLAAASLLAPEDRLWRQIATLGLHLSPGDRTWRTRLRAEYGFGGDGKAPAHAGPFAPGPHVDPAAHLIAALAERNNCPPSLIAAQLDGMDGALDWGGWTVELLREIPELQMRYQAAARMFHLAAVQAGGNVRGGHIPDVQPIYVQLSL